MKKVMLASLGLFCFVSHLQTNQYTVTEQLTTSNKLIYALSKKELIEQLKNNIDSFLTEKRTHPLTMAVIHFLNLSQNPKPQPKPTSHSSSKPQRIPTGEEFAIQDEHIKNAIKEVVLAILTQQAEELDAEINELLEQLKNS